MKQGRKSFRMRFTFWLDDLRPDENELITYIEDLKQQRKFVTTIKQGLRLMKDLRAGGVDVLIELFPHLGERLRPDIGTAASDSFNALLQQLNRLERQIATGSMAQVTLPTFSPMPAVEVRVIENEEERKKLSVQNTLAALEDF